MSLPPSAPFRVDLATALKALGRDDEAAGHYACGCGRGRAGLLPADSFIDVRDLPERFPAAFVCTTCAADLLREETYAHEQALQAHQEAEGAIGEEKLNDLRAQRDVALQRSDWTQLQDNRERIGPEASARWDAYRAAWREWFATARDSGTIGDLPEAPE